jgi:circadian clock protein KaiB
MSDKILLRLFVTGRTARAEKAIDGVKRLCEHQPEGRYELEVIDVLEDPQAAQNDEIVVTPTLFRRGAGPPRRVVGDLTDLDLVALKLDLIPLSGLQEHKKA